MCKDHTLSLLKPLTNSSSLRHFLIYGVAITLAIISGITHIPWIHEGAEVLSDSFVKIFKCLSLPLISLSLLVTITGFEANHAITKLGKKVLTYTFGTTIIATIISFFLYLLFNPSAEMQIIKDTNKSVPIDAHNYWEHISTLIPSNFLEPFLKHQVMSVLLVTIVLGLAIRLMPHKHQRDSIVIFFQGLHTIFMTLTRWVIVIIPVALYAFITVSIIQFNQGLDLSGIGRYLLIIVLANSIQGFVILPVWLKWKGFSPIETLRGLMPALSLAFFSKSSSGTLPVTINCLVNLKVKPEIANFVLPLCTTINMNGCAAFIFTTVLFVAQSNGVEFSYIEMLSWILIATIAAIGNAGVPMGCFFLSASLLSTMGIPLTLLGIILPIYGLLDMFETALNVWSDACVTRVAVQTGEY